MTKLELIRQIGDLLSEIDVLRGSLMPHDENRVQFDDLRELLDRRQSVLASIALNENLQPFQDATRDLATLNNGINTTLNDLNQMQNTIKSIGKYMSVLDSIIAFALKHS